MSEIDIEKKETGGVPWWAWLLGALVLASLIWYATAAMSGKPNVDQVAVGADNSTAMMADTNSATDTNAAMMADVNAVGDANAVADANAAMIGDANSAMANSASTMDANAVTTGNSAMASGAITDILSIVDNKSPASLYGKKVDLLGAPVQAAGTKVFWIGPSFEQKMLVVTDDSTTMSDLSAGVQQSDRLNIVGDIREITDFKEAKAKYNLDDKAITFLTNKKILLHATSVSKDKM